jgi:cyclopropane fatty-acyl-phospholipid synthase-like methyltransferase
VGQVSEFARRYDALMLDPRVAETYGGTDFFNVGYWLPDTSDQRTACENMVARLLQDLPATGPRILDAGCGWGATTAYVRRSLRDASVFGINVSWNQLRRSTAAAPGCRFALVDAAELAFGDGSFDGVLSVEAAFHFRSRARFFAEAHRVLRDGGHLALSDILFRDSGVIGDWMVPPENALAGPAEYRALLVAAGFEGVSVMDATAECWRAFCTAQVEAARRRFAHDGLDEDLLAAQTYFETLRDSVGHYLFVSARKARSGAPARRGAG